MRLLLGLGVLATTTGCGEKKVDAYAESLARGSEHVEVVATVRGRKVTASGDFTNVPDRGRMVVHSNGKSFVQVYANGRVYVHTFGRWLSSRVDSRHPQTPAQMFRRRLPAVIERDLVRSITVHDAGSTATYTFSKYGERVSVTVPRVKGTK